MSDFPLSGALTFAEFTLSMISSLPVLAEGDFIYTSTLLNLDSEDYAGKEILILGGGDGGILHELLKCQPKFITMAEISSPLLPILCYNLHRDCLCSMLIKCYG